MTVESSNSGIEAAPAARPVNARAVFITVIVAVFVTNLDLFVVNVALPSIGHDFHGTSLDSLSWVLNAYAIVFASLLVVAGRLADRNGHRPAFLIGLAVFTLGSTLCAASTDIGWLVAARILQAVGAATLLPTSLALLLATTAPERRQQVVRAWTAVGGVAAALGPVLGGLLVQASWRWVFLINVPIGILAIVAAFRTLPDVRREDAGRMPDVAGAVLLTASIGILSLGLVRGDTWGWSSGRAVGSFAAAFVLLVAFLISSARHPAPVVELPLLRIRAFSTANVATLLFSAAFAGMILSTVLWCQNVWGYSALRTGLAIAPGPLMVPPLAIAAGPLAKRVGAGPVAAVGNLFFALAVLYWPLRVGTTPHYASDFLPGMMFGGVGVGLALPTLVASGATVLPAPRFATGSGILNMSRQIGAVLGVAILVGIVGSPTSAGSALNAFKHGWYGIVVLAAVAAVASLFLGRAHAPAASAAGSPAQPAVPAAPA
jgi:EmrB/QacA subfamily drug resistance transporter